MSLPQPLNVAREHLKIGQQIMWPQHRLRPPHVSVTGHYRARVLSCQCQQLRHQPLGRFNRLLDGSPQPQSGVQRYLLVPAATRVDFVRHRPGLFLQFADYKRVHVLIRRSGKVALLPPLNANRVEGRNYGRPLLDTQNSHTFQCPRKSLRPSDVRRKEALVKMQRFAEFLKEFVLASLKAASIELVLHCFRLS